MAELIASNSLLKFGILIALFVLVAGASYIVAGAVNARQLSKRRLQAIDGGLEEPTMLVPSLRAEQANAAWRSLVDKIETTGLSLVDSKDEALRRKLAAAGYTASYAPRLYTLIRLTLVIGLPLLVLLLLWLSGSTMGIMKLYFSLLLSAAAGLYVPSIFVRAKADRRQREIINAFPDALDLMLVCVEAGLGLEAAFSRVGMEMTRSHPLLAEQLGTVVLELRAGRSQEDALRRMADRAGADEIRAFATLLIQSHKLGSSVAQTLRTYASEMRERRRMRAEEKAHRLPVLLSIPLVTCMLPVMIGVLMLPAVIRTMRVVVPAMGG